MQVTISPPIQTSLPMRVTWMRAGSSERCALAHDVGLRRVACSDEPLRKTGVKASGYRIFARVRAHERPHLELRTGSVMVPVPGGDHAEGLPVKRGEVPFYRQQFGPRAKHHGYPAGPVVDPLRGLDPGGIDLQRQRDPGDRVRRDLPTAL